MKGCDARAVAGLVRETQLKREDVVIIGVRCGGVVADPASPEAALPPRPSPTAAPAATAREPHLADHLVGELPPPPPGRERAGTRGSPSSRR